MSDITPSTASGAASCTHVSLPPDAKLLDAHSTQLVAVTLRRLVPSNRIGGTDSELVEIAFPESTQKDLFWSVTFDPSVKRNAGRSPVLPDALQFTELPENIHPLWPFRTTGET
jgi:hypothetical protein